MRPLLRGMLVVLTLVAVLYAVDYLRLRRKILLRQEPFGSVQVSNFTSIQQKNNRVEYHFDGVDLRGCAHSLFPHFGYSPCWYLQRHTENRTEL